MIRSAKRTRPLRSRTINSKFTKWSLEIHRSAIHGTGVFALAPIPRGARVVEYTGQRISPAEAHRRSQSWERRGAREPIYLASVSARRVIDGAFGGCGAELVNHSCAPNLSPLKRRGRLWLVSKRRIAAGEELTLDYAVHPDAVHVKCRCGAKNCRGTINLKRKRVPKRKRSSTLKQGIRGRAKR
jgi:SET domain-containing protein